MVFILEGDADCAGTGGLSKGSSMEFRKWWDGGVIFCAKHDPDVGVWLLDRDLAELRKLPDKIFFYYHHIQQLQLVKLATTLFQKHYVADFGKISCQYNN